MHGPVLEIDGTAEFIRERLADFAGQQLHVTVQRIDDEPAGRERPLAASSRPRGLCKGQFVVTDSFRDPLPPDIQTRFEAGQSDCSQL